jgi:membrane fusion protein (multidrug efflux system)
VDVHVTQYQQVEPGDPLLSIRSPEWRDIQEELVAAYAAVQVAGSRITLAEARLTEAGGQRAALVVADGKLNAVREARERISTRQSQAIALWQSRLEALEKLAQSGAPKASETAAARASLLDAETSLAETQEKLAELEVQRAQLSAEISAVANSLPRLEEEMRAARVDRDAAAVQADAKLQSAAALLDVETAWLREEIEGAPRWRSLQEITITANVSGTVESLQVNSGSWVQANSDVLSTIDVSKLRVRANALQVYLTRVKPGQQASILPPGRAATSLELRVGGTVKLPNQADAQMNTFELLVMPESVPGWAMPGAAVHVDVVLESTGEGVLAVPKACVVRDELQHVVFRRDPKDPDKVIRIDAELGRSDGQWVEMKVGVIAGDEVVLDGVYELKLTGSGKAPKGGHFHADGTWHEGED